jgi:hypothetical protein
MRPLQGRGGSLGPRSGGVAPLNPWLPYGKPSACSSLMRSQNNLSEGSHKSDFAQSQNVGFCATALTNYSGPGPGQKAAAT